ncbi:biotin--[acetyl-CoA-carboxylase] ligase [Marinihelvus fidelis]|nr:biotin--[acetyl-CoA-carboxylase] ligase [Marinihelvus fidelis]
MTEYADAGDTLVLSDVLEAAGSAGRRVALERVEDIDSTNAELLRRAPAERQAVALLAEHQSGGRGRRGRDWHSPRGRNVYLSLGWRFAPARSDLVMLPLVVAVAAARALKSLGATDIGIKWPNDLWLDGCKVGGCLVETTSSAGGMDAVIGVGLNVGMTGDPGARNIERQWADLRDQLPDLSRSRAAGALLAHLVRAAEAFSAAGFAGFAQDWVRMDVLRGRTVVIERDGAELDGRALGLGAGGGLLVDGPDGPVECMAGEVRVHTVDGRPL